MKTAVEIAMEKDTGYVPHGLSREQLIKIIRGTELAHFGYGILDEEIIMKAGTFTDLNGWRWGNLEKLTDAELEVLYCRLQ